MNCIRCFFSMFWGTCKTQRQWIQRSVSAVKVFRVLTTLNQATTCMLKRALQHVVGPQYIYQGSAFLPVRTVSQLYFQDKECCEICKKLIIANISCRKVVQLFTFIFAKKVHRKSMHGIQNAQESRVYVGLELCSKLTNNERLWFQIY